MCLSPFIGKLPAESIGGGWSVGILGAHLDAQQSRKQVLFAGETVGWLLQTRELAVPSCCLSLPGVFY